MKIGIKTQYLKNGEMKLFSYVEHTFKMSEMDKPIRKWYKHNHYAKRLNKKWICQDYRIDQQRPQRNVYSEAYIKIVEISEMEEIHLTKLINELESKIDYPTVWDDGKNRYYEDTIHCPNCDKRRKVLTSKTHCEFCGFEFAKALKCPKCKDLSPTGSNHCIHCGHDLNVKSRLRKYIPCTECNKLNSPSNNYCIVCGHKLQEISSDDKVLYRKYCSKCGKVLGKDDNFCIYCGHDKNEKTTKTKVCSVCGTWCSDDKYCWNCGHDNHSIRKKGNNQFGALCGKVCPNCNAKHERRYGYCEECGTKLKVITNMFEDLMGKTERDVIWDGE